MAEEIKIMNCINCPMGCEIKVTMEKEKIKKIEGNSCPRGEVYIRAEIKAPKRMLTSTVRRKEGNVPVLPVVSAGVLPKESILPCVAALRQVVAKAPIKAGDVIIANILGLGVDVVSSRDMDSRVI